VSPKKLLILFTILVLVIIFFIRFSSPEDTWLCQNNTWVKHGNPQQNQPTTGCGNPKACTMEAKLCPDGSAVGRSGPNCEFTPCPE
jgi:hypothetical protein